MIVEMLGTAVAWFIEFIAGVMFDLIPPPPDWVATSMGYLSDFWAVLDSFQTWLPISLALVIAGVVAAVYALGLMVGLFRVVASYLTFGGGAT